jgi:gamma-glutamyltranspeptidase/glutathione hydrolase
MTTTIEENLGSAVVVDGRGFLLNNEMTDFDAIPFDNFGHTVPNAATGKRKFRRTAIGDDASTIGGKRPMSSMTPVIILQPDGGVLAGRIDSFSSSVFPFTFQSVGSPGGNTIIGSVMNAIISLVKWGISLQASVDATRVISRNTVSLVDGNLSISDEDTLRRWGFKMENISTRTRPRGFVEAVRIKGKSYDAAADGTRLDTAFAIAE